MIIFYGKQGRKGQIATILTLAIAAIFVFVVITLNMRRVTQRKALLNNACDGAALMLASNLGSLGNKLSQEYLEGRTKITNLEPWYIAKVLGGAVITVGGAVAGFFFAPAWSATIFGVHMTAVALGIAATTGLMVAGELAHVIAIEPMQFNQVSLYFKQMTAEQQLIEGAIQYAIFASVDDQKEVVDVFDDDGDGLKTDKILRLTQEYYQRLRELSKYSLKTLINGFITELSSLVRTEENDQWQITRTWMMLNPQSPQTAFVDWLKNEFIPLLQLLEGSGYPVSFWKPKEPNDAVDLNDAVDELIWDIAGSKKFGPGYEGYPGFEDWAQGILELSPEQRLAGFDQWYNQLIIPDKPDPDALYWQERITAWQNSLNAWINELNLIQMATKDKDGFSGIEECVGSCKGLSDKDKYGDPVCCEKGIRQVPCRPTEDVPIEMCDEEYCVRYGCCGEPKSCCALCGDATCPPGACCNTCCQIQPTCDRETSKIVRAITDHLNPFRKNLAQFSNFLVQFKSDVQKFKAGVSESRDWTYPPKGSTWKWEDTAGEHKVEVAVEDLPQDFKGPYLQPGRNWWKIGGEKHIALMNYEGNFRMKVSRQDKEKAEGMKGILDLLKWDRTITSEVKASYGITKDKIRIIQRIK